MRIILYSSFERISDKSVVRKLNQALNDRGILHTLASDSATNFEGRSVAAVADCVQNADVLVVLGGDGTVLNAVKCIGRYSIPVLAVNLGTVGFLTEVEYNEIEFALTCLLQNRYTIEERSLLKINYDSVEYTALNEVVLSKGHNTRPIRLTVEYDGKLLDKYLADGLIVSTPTGSTAYSLSAGGPILGPDIKAFIVNTICAHSLHSRPIVMADSHKITLSVPELFQPADLVIDGQFVTNVTADKMVTVTKAGFSAKFIRLKNDGFYDKLLKN
jgi:Predicted sugar kinase